ncbi:MAG: hypothetical protein K8W52_02215 [Deltaproteobacteria bacterium]|nr:hypothetical protein [Deltaproteobacteria bacterium]
MTAVDAAGVVRLGAIELTDQWLREVEGSTRLVSIPRAEVRRVVLRHARIAERPLLSLVVGIVLTTVGAYGAIATAASRVRYVELVGGFLTMLAAGPWMIHSSFRRGLVLHVETDRGTRTLGLGGAVQSPALEAFIEAAAQAGLIIERERVEPPRAVIHTR